MKTVTVTSFGKALPNPLRDGRRILVCQDPEHNPLDWVPLVFLEADGRLPDRSDGRIRAQNAAKGILIGEPGPWGVPDAEAIAFAARMADADCPGYWCDDDLEVVALGDLVVAGCTWMVPPSGALDA
jgi:hypothetical protein